jgi:predicted dehydrogenase
MSRLKLGILGVSRHFVTRVLPALQQSTVIEVYGIASRDAAKAQNAALQYQISQSYGSYEALLQDPAVEAVYIPLPNDRHVPWIKKAVDYGKAVICESGGSRGCFGLCARQRRPGDGGLYVSLPPPMAAGGEIGEE